MEEKHFEVKQKEYYEFPDGSVLEDFKLAQVYNEYYKQLQYIFEDLNDFILYRKQEVTNEYVQYDKEKVLEFKKKIYNILREIYRDINGNNTSYEEKYFNEFVDNPENDLSYAQRCFFDLNIGFVTLSKIGDIVLSFSNDGKKFPYYGDKCYYLEKHSL